MQPALFLACAAGLGIFCLVLGFALTLQRRLVTAERLQAYATLPDVEVDESAKSLAATVNRWLARNAIGAGIARKLAQADVKLTVAEYALVHAGLLAGALILGPVVFGSPTGAVLLAPILLIIPHVYLSSCQQKRQRAFDEQLPTALNSLANGLRGGYGLIQAMSLVAAELSPPASVEFKRLVTEVGYGMSYDQSFKNMLRRNPGSDLALVITAIEIHMQMGGNLADILDSIGSIIRDRVRIQGQIKAYTAQQRLSAGVLLAMPFVLAAIIYMSNSAYLSLLWSTPGGLMMLALAGIMMTAGALMLRKLARIDV